MNDKTYIPFEDGLIFESQGYSKVQKCQFCSKLAEHANCKAHRKECPLYCDNLNQPPSVCVGGWINYYDYPGINIFNLQN